MYFYLRVRVHQASVSTQNHCCNDTCDIALIEWMELLQNGLQPHPEVILFVSIDVSESYVASVIAGLNLR